MKYQHIKPVDRKEILQYKLNKKIAKIIYNLSTIEEVDKFLESFKDVLSPTQVNDAYRQKQRIKDNAEMYGKDSKLKRV